MVVAAMQGADQHIRSSLGFRILPKDTLTCRPGRENQRPSNNKALALPLSYSLYYQVTRCELHLLYLFLTSNVILLFCCIEYR